MSPRFTYFDAAGGTRLKAWALPLVVAAIALPVAAGFLLGGPAVGLPVTAIAAWTIAIVAIRSRPLRAMEVAGSSDERRRLLVLALQEVDEAAAGRLRELAAGAADVRVLVPTPSGRLSRWLSAEDSARRQGQNRLARSAGTLTAAGLAVSGSVGDSDPVQAVEDELRSFAADEVLVLADPDADAPVEALRNRLALPLTTVRPG
jgi:hypothetical protein